MYFFYVLQSIKTGTYYVGCTDNIERRLKEHNNGLSKYTRSHRPLVLKYTETFTTLSEARKREKVVKSWKKRSRIESLLLS